MANSNEPTTFGVTIERKQAASPTPSSPGLPVPSMGLQAASSRTSYHSALASPSPTPGRHSLVPSQLHLSSATTTVEQPLPSPFSIPDSQHEKGPDLESGIYRAPTQSSSIQQSPVVGTFPSTTQLSVPHQPSPTRQPSVESSASSRTITYVSPQDEKNPITCTTSTNLATTNSEQCTMWPTSNALKQKAKKQKRSKHAHNPLMRLSKRNRVIVSVVLALLVIGLAVGIGVGISKKYGGEVWAGPGKSKPLDAPKS